MEVGAGDGWSRKQELFTTWSVKSEIVIILIIFIAQFGDFASKLFLSVRRYARRLCQPQWCMDFRALKCFSLSLAPSFPFSLLPLPSTPEMVLAGHLSSASRTLDPDVVDGWEAHRGSSSHSGLWMFPFSFPQLLFSCSCLGDFLFPFPLDSAERSRGIPLGIKGNQIGGLALFFLWADRKREGLLFYVESNGVKFTGFVSWRSLNQTPKRQSMHHIL